MQSATDIKTIINELIEMKQGSLRLSKRKNERAKELLVSLRCMGYNAKEISEMIGGSWKESAIRSYIRGVQLDRNSKVSNANLNNVPKAIAFEHAKEMINEASSIEKRPEDSSVLSKDVTDPTLEILHGEVDITEFVHADNPLKPSQDLMPNLTKVLNHQKILKEMGINATTIGKLVDIDMSMQLINASGLLEHLQSEVDHLNKKREELLTTISTMESKYAYLEEQKDSIKTYLELYEQLVQKGFTQTLLRKVVEACAKYRDADQVLEAINRYASLSAINDEINNKTAESRMLEGNVQRLKKETLHEKEIATTCRQLLQLKFNVSTLQRIYQTAKQYGDPVEVLKAIDKYGKLSALEKENEQIKHERDGALNKINELKRNLSNYNDLDRQLKQASSDLTEVENKTIMLIRESIQELEKPVHLRTYPKTLIDSGLANRLEGTFERELTKQLNMFQDSELLRLYKQEVEHQLDAILKSWPSKSLGKRTIEKENTLRQRATTNPLLALRRNWGIHCEKCGDDWPHNVTLDTYTIQQLLIGNSIDIPNCKLKVGTEGTHTISLSLKDIIKLYLEQYIDDI